MEELSAWLRLARLPSLGADTLTPLLHRFGSVGGILDADATELAAAQLSAKTIRLLQHFDPAVLESDLLWATTAGNGFIPLTHADYPPLLNHVSGAPVGLFVRGRVAALHAAQLAIVGARNPTSIGRENSTAFAAHLAACGIAITSGLAAGIDAAAHRGALSAKGVTIAVCATGLDTVYPPDHAALAESICERGALVSEFPPGVMPRRRYFPRRNRLISGLSLGTLVVEAALASGSLITARFAADQGREVFAIPGSIHNPLSRGCHRLLRNGAKLVESADDILAELGPLAAAAREAARTRHARSGTSSRDRDYPATLDKEYKILLDALGFEPASVDQLVARTGMRADAVASMLLILELDGRVECGAGAMYLRTRASEVQL